MILASLVYVPTGKAKFQRNLFAGFVVGWWTTTIIQSGQYTILQEAPFGGYRIHIKWKDWAWAVNTHSIHFENAIEFMYATPPGSSTPVHMGEVHIVIKYEAGHVDGYIINIQNIPNDNHYTFVRFPQPTDPYYWKQQPHTFPATYQYVP